jgi:hypothetical protein
LVMLIIVGGAKAQAQGFPSASSSTTGFFSQAVSAVGGFFSQDLPGAFDNSMPLLFPPYFGGEVHIRPYFFGLVNGEVDVAGIKIDLETQPGNESQNPLHNYTAIGLSSKGSLVEFMGRFQLSRLSLRAYYNYDLRRIPANYGAVGWMDYRLGLDLDIINSYGVIFGINADMYESPSLKYNSNSGLATNSPKNSNGDAYFKSVGGTITGNTPITYGIHASYNPFNSWIVSPTIEFRYQWPYENRPGQSLAGNASQLSQWEYAVGLKLPKTVLGSSGLRFGYRDSILQFAGGQGSDNRSAVITLQTAGYFGDFVWFY